MQSDYERQLGMTLPDSELREWADSESVTKRIAAHIAAKIRSGALNRWDGLPENTELARDWDTTTRTVTRAKALLAARGLVRLSGGKYYVA